jgi:aminopeptidase N
MLLLLLHLATQAPAAGPDTSAGVQQALQYDITLVPSDSSTHLLGEVQTTWRLRSAAPVAMLLDSTFRVIRVLMDGKPNTRLSRTLYGRSASDIVVPHEKTAGDTLTTRVRYHGLVTAGFRLGPNRFGERTAFSDSPPGPVSGWLPVPNDSTAAATVAFNVQADSGQQVIANGVLQRVDTLGYGHTTWHYRLDATVPLDAIAVGVARFARTVVGDTACGPSCPPIAIWTFPRDSAYAVEGPFRRAGAIARYLTGVLGRFPYPRLTHVESTSRAASGGGGGVVFYGEAGYAGRSLDEPAVAAATAGQWFDAALPGGEPSRLGQGIATYLAALWRGHANGDSAFTRVMRSAADSVFRAGGQEYEPASARGAWVLHQLRGMVGDSAFFAGLRGFAATPADSVPAPTRLARGMSAAAGRDLTWYFQQALSQRGYAELQLRWRRRSGRQVLEIRQVQPAEWGEYRIPGLVLRVDGRPMRVDVSGRVTEQAIPGISRRPRRVEVDPDGWWLLKVVDDR